MSKQTAVDWFAERIQSNKIFNFENVLKQAKAMEKEQIETLYTEEQVREAIRMAQTRKYNSHFYNADEIIKSLKQPKQ